MKTAAPPYRLFWAFAVFLFTCASALAWWEEEPVILLFPFVAITCYTWWQFPQLAYYCLLFTLPFSFEFHFAGGWSTDLPDEPLMLVVSFIAIAVLIFNAEKRELFIREPLIQLVLLWLMWVFVSGMFSSHPFVSLKFLLAKSWYIGAFLLAPVVLLENERHLRIATIALLSALLIVVIIILARHAFTGFTFATINEAVAPFFRNHVNYSAMLVCCFPVAGVIYWQSRRRTRQWILLIIIFVMLPALFFSYARGAWLALAAGTVGWFLLRARLLFAAYITAIFILIGSLCWLANDDHYVGFAHNHERTIYHEDFGEHIRATYQMRDISAAERYYRWIAAVNMTNEEPLTGFGPGTFYNNYQSYTVPAFKTWVSNNPEKSTAHNYFLLVAAELGLPGVILLLILLGYCFWLAQKQFHGHDSRWKKGIAVVSAVMLVMIVTLNLLSDLIETDKVGSLFFLSLALLVRNR